MSGVHTHMKSRFYPGYGTRILGGSEAQSRQVYDAIEQVVGGRDGRNPERLRLTSLLATRGKYVNGSDVSILPASKKSVRGPHVPGLKFDEVDEIDEDIRESAMGMALNRGDYPSQVIMTSTWHNLDGPMSRLMANAPTTGMPVHRYCVFEVLERCPASRSGENLEKCDACLIKKWCHSDRLEHPKRLPKAKRSDGHISIDSLIQKVMGVSERAFESDYLCLGPKAAGVWFESFSEAENVSVKAEFDPAIKFHCSVDVGVFTGIVFFQKTPDLDIHVFDEYFSVNQDASLDADETVVKSAKWSKAKPNRVSMDASAAARNAVVGTQVSEIYRAAGLVGSDTRTIERWPIHGKPDGLALLESLIRAADGTRHLFIHPRCVHLIAALKAYRRAKRSGQWTDVPEDPQHPAEDMVDALVGGLRLEFPEGRAGGPKVRTTIQASRVF